jgi:hypothetical protein
MYPVDSPGVLFIRAITQIFAGGGYNYKLVWAYYIMITTYGIPSFASHAIDQDIIPATVRSLAVMEGGLGEIPYMRDVNLAGSRVVLYQVGTDSLWQTDELFAFKSITPFIPDHLFLENIRKKGCVSKVNSILLIPERASERL